MAVIVGPGGPFTATKLAIDGPGDHRWRDRPAGTTRARRYQNVSSIPINSQRLHNAAIVMYILLVSLLWSLK